MANDNIIIPDDLTDAVIDKNKYVVVNAPNAIKIVTNTSTVEGGLPNGGTTGQVLAKATDADYDVDWIDTGSGGGGVPTYVVEEGTSLEDVVLPMSFINSVLSSKLGSIIVDGEPFILNYADEYEMYFILTTLTSSGAQIFGIEFNSSDGTFIETSQSDLQGAGICINIQSQSGTVSLTEHDADILENMPQLVTFKYFEDIKSYLLRYAHTLTPTHYFTTAVDSYDYGVELISLEIDCTNYGYNVKHYRLQTR